MILESNTFEKNMQFIPNKYLNNTLQSHNTDRSVTRYIGIHLVWDYVNERVHMFMPDYYVKKALNNFNTNTNFERNNYNLSPLHIFNKEERRNNMQNNNQQLPRHKSRTKIHQQVCGKFLYYGRAVDSTLLTPISAIAA